MNNRYRNIAIILILGLLHFVPINLNASSFMFQDKVTEDTAKVNEAFKLFNEIKAADRYISNLDSLYVIDLPVGIKSKDSANADQYVIMISEIKLRGGETFLTAYMAGTIPGTTKKIAFKGTDIPFSYSGGIKGEVSLELVSDFKAELNSNIDLIIKGNGDTRVWWDCKGFRQMDIAGDVIFDSTLFVPENPDGSLKNSKALRTSFQTSINSWNDFMVGVSMEPFQLKGLKGVGFSVSNAILDLSDYKNPANITFGPDYADYFIEGNPNIWQGVYIQDVQVRMPPQFRTKNLQERKADSILIAKDTTGNLSFSNSVAKGRLTFYGQNMFVDELGFTGRVGASELMNLNEGDLDGWAYSVKNLVFDIQASHLVAAGFDGQINVPQFKQNTLFNYSAVIGLDDTYGFNVAITDTISMEVWKANLDLEPNSTVYIQVIEQEFRPALLLNGTLSINSSTEANNPESPKLALVNIGFQEMKIQTIEPYFDVEQVSFGTEQNRFSKFPVSIKEVGFESVENRYGLTLGLTVHFTGEKDDAFGGEGNFTVWGKQETGKWKYDGLEINKILVDISKGEKFSLKGGVWFIRGDEVYGNGFKGALEATFGGFGMQATALFGNVDNYRYWYADALLSSSKGIPVGPLALYGFGGGAHYHMQQEFNINTPVSDIGKSISGFHYAPDNKKGLGLQASVKFGLDGNVDALNGDVLFAMNFNNSGGISNISFTGNAEFATEGFETNTQSILDNATSILENEKGELEMPQKIQDAQLSAYVYMNYDFENSSFHSTFDVFANVFGGAITGVGPGGKAGWGIMHFDPNDWYVYLGTPNNPIGLNVLGISEITSYFMTGKSIPELPNPPKEVTDRLENYEVQDLGLKEPELVLDGSGFAFGGNFFFDTGERTFLIFYGRFGCGLGFDILLKNYGELACENTGNPIGINGWYAQGQAYAWIDAKVGIHVSLPFYSGNYTIFDANAAALLETKAPNPFWMRGMVDGEYNILGGMIKGHYDFDFEIGEKCKFPASNPLGGMSIIADIKPMDKENEVSVFNTPQVMFNLPVNEEIVFTNEYNITKKYRIKLDHFKVTNESGQVIKGTLTWNERNDVLAFKPSVILPGRSVIKGEAKVSFEEYKSGGWFQVTNNGVVSEEQKSISFTTGEQPDHIPQHNVKYSYPGYRAFNYYKTQTNENYVTLEQGQNDLFRPGQEWIQKARIKPVKGGTAQYLDYSYDFSNYQVNLELPSALSNNIIYRFDLVNIPVEQSSILDANVSDQTESVTIGDESYSTDVEIITQTAEESRSELQEKVIYSMEFRTSNYNTLTEKLNSLTYSDGVTWELQPLIHSITVNISGERFDAYEVLNLQTNTMLSSTALLDQTPWYTDYIKPVTNLSASNLSLIGAKPFDVNPLCSYFFQSGGTRILTEEEIESGIVGDANVLSGMKNYIAKYSFEYINQLKNKIANSYVERANIPAGQLNTLFYSRFTPLRYGNYPVRIDYTLPGKTTPVVTKTHNIWLRD